MIVRGQSGGLAPAARRRPTSTSSGAGLVGSPRTGQDGFTLIEVLVALMILASVCGLVATFMVGAVRTTSEQSHKQNATALATEALEAVQATPVDGLLTGRTQASVQGLHGNTWFAPLVVQDVISAGNFDASATAASVANIPVTTTQSLQRMTYTVHTSINRCFLSRTTRSCTRVAASDGISVVRATVQVVWGKASCGSQCRYAASALLDTQA
jgi:prepilin-type N-terminal cleavage/methylation domain-containing protein